MAVEQIGSFSYAREERGQGVPLTDAERQSRHFEQTGNWLEVLPPRGTGLGAIGGFTSDFGSFVRQYPLQVAMVAIALIAILVNIKSTRTLVKSLQIGR